MFDPSVAPLHVSASVVDTIRKPLPAGGPLDFAAGLWAGRGKVVATVVALAAL